jgi:hypothetical protein
MSILRDFNYTFGGYRYPHQIKEYLDLGNWRRVHKWRKQRLNRGWSDRDTWGAGEHIAQMTAEMLKHLNENTYVDWPEWFKLNVKEKGHGSYTSLEQVIKDITEFLDFNETSWADGLDTKRDSVDEIFEKRQDGNYEYKGPDWYEKGKKLSDAAVKHRINKWQKEWNLKYKKATKAMQFFGRHFASFWD